MKMTQGYPNYPTLIVSNVLKCPIKYLVNKINKSCYLFYIYYFREHYERFRI